MASGMSKILLRQMKNVSPFLRLMTFDGMRSGQDLLGKLGAQVVRNRVTFSPENFDSFTADWALPVEESEKGIILYLHGGSYVAGGLAYSHGFGGILADAVSRKTLCVAYRLAPENPYPSALDDAFEAYVRITEKYPGDKIAIVGESAGGGLSFALACKLKGIDIKQPSCIVGISPWADLTCTSATFTENAGKDPCLFPDMLRSAAHAYIGPAEKAINPLISPIFADLSGLAPALLFAGGNEMLLDDSRTLAKNCKEQGVDVSLHVTAGMWHAFVLFGTPEAKEALQKISVFINEHLTS